MTKFKKILAVFLAVSILSLTVGSDYIDARYSEVDAAAIAAGVGMTAKTLFDICLFVGATLATCYVVGEVIDNKEEIARAGKNFIDSVTEIPEGWILSITGESGQEYVIGSEALELVQATGWEVIQGGAGGGNKPDDNDKFNIADNEMIGHLTALGATWFVDNASKLYQKWAGGTEELTEAEAAVIEPLIGSACNQYDIAAQWSGEPFAYDMTLRFEYDFSNSGHTSHYVELYDINFIFSGPVCAFIQNSKTYSGAVHVRNNYSFYLNCIDSDGHLSYISPSGIFRIYKDGIISHESSILFNQGISTSESLEDGASKRNLNISFSGNIPFFMIDTAPAGSSVEDYLRGITTAESALNYAKIWREADWLADDWQGVLIDPLTNIGLSLSQLVDLAKALGLHAVGNSLTPADIADLIGESLPKVNPALLPDAVGVPAITPDPDLAPIYWPSADAHPIPDPGTNPGTNPKPGTDPDPDDSADDDINIKKYKTDLTGIFPFCIPFDFIALLETLDAEPVAPHFDIPVVIPALGYEETFSIDLAFLDEVARIVRICETISFIIFLMFVTQKVIKW